MNTDRPIFIGGTGRSGTTVMGRLLNSHADVVLPTLENKLIVERFGLISVVNELSAGFDFKSNHRTIENFVYWSNVLRKSGFKSKAAKRLFDCYDFASWALGKGQGTRETFCRTFPFFDFSLHAVGQGFGYQHYDGCVKRFLEKIISDTINDGLFDTEGLLKPFYIPSTFCRNELLNYSREFLRNLYKLPMEMNRAIRWCDDTPKNVVCAEFLTELFPSCSIIHIVRDPRDVLSSYLDQAWAASDLEISLQLLQRYYRSLIDIENSKFGTKIIRIRLEDITKNFNAEMAKVCSIIELREDGFNNSIIFNSSSFGRYKRFFSRKEISIIEAKLGFAIEYFGY